jgi:hypothetical protein
MKMGILRFNRIGSNKPNYMGRLWNDALAAGRKSDYFWQLLAEIGR